MESKTQSKPRAVAGVAAVCLILACSRWGSYLGVAPLFVTDVLIALAVLKVITRNSRLNSKTDWARRSTPGVLLFAFAFFLVCRMVTSLTNGTVIDWLRDGVPYLYCVLTFLSASSLSMSTEAGRERTFRWIWAALLVHLSWTAPAVLFNLVSDFQPAGLGAPMFQVRPDIDAALTAITGAIAIRRWLRHERRWVSGSVAVLAFVVVLSLGTRAGLLSLMTALAVTAATTYGGANKAGRTKFILALPALGVALAGALVATTPGQRLLATVDPTLRGSVAQLNAQGTQRAREFVWTGVIDWVQENPVRFVFGGGFGNDFLSQSGTLGFLEGTTYSGVRSPHNWLVGTFARLGLVGVVLVIAIILQLLAFIVRQRQAIASDNLLFAAALITCTLLPVSLLGVVLEAPFGAVPFWWSAGVLYAALPRSAKERAKQRREREQLEERTRQALAARAKLEVSQDELAAHHDTPASAGSRPYRA